MSALDAKFKGKTFLAPQRLLRAEVARYFPNLRGYTLQDYWTADQDTCVAMKGKVSLVSVYSRRWAERQTKTWVGPSGGESVGMLADEMGLQKVEINVEERRFWAGLLWLFCGSLRRARREEEWGRYFVVRRGFGEQVRSDLGILNGKVGYVYLVDWEGRIRWAGSGECEEGSGEREGLVRGARKLLDMWKEEMAGEMKREQGVRKVVDTAAGDSGQGRKTKGGSRVVLRPVAQPLNKVKNRCATA